jgi:hypothetical protein
MDSTAQLPADSQVLEKIAKDYANVLRNTVTMCWGAW